MQFPRNLASHVAGFAVAFPNTFCRRTHPSKAFAPIAVTSSGITIAEREEQFEKADSPTLWIPSGRERLERAVEPVKAKGTIAETDPSSGITDVLQPRTSVLSDFLMMQFR